MLVVHHLGISQSERIVWLCEELGIPYQLQRHDRDPTTRMAPAAYKALHPQGTAPVITDGDLALPESGAIAEYVNAVHGGGRLAIAAGETGYAEYLYWLHYANGSFMPVLMMQMMARSVGAPENGPLPSMVWERLATASSMIERRLSEADYFAGERLTLADIMMVFALTTMRNFSPLDLGDMPSTRAYLKRIGERPAYRLAMEKGDPEMTPKLD